MNIHVLKCAMANSGNRIGPNGILYNVTAYNAWKKSQRYIDKLLKLQM